MMEGHEVIVLDNFFTGQRKNVEHWMHHPHFTLVVHDVTEPIMLEVDEIYHLACPASPPHYQYNPVKTIKTSTMGTINMLGLAKRVKAKILLTSTSEVSLRRIALCFFAFNRVFTIISFLANAKLDHRSMETPKSTPSPNRTGAMSIPSDPVHATTKESVWPKP
jgi:hypothetical protein